MLIKTETNVSSNGRYSTKKWSRGRILKKWFAESNESLSKINGFISRRLLKSNDDKHRIIVEHQSKETFTAMFQNDEHAKIQSKAFSFMGSSTMPRIYDVIAN